MSRFGRGEQFNPHEVSVVHCYNRCVRRCFLCGIDPLTGFNYEHRKTWTEDRLEFLAAYYGIDVLGFAIMGNHFHVILRNRPDVVKMWSDEEVARRWLMLCPIRKKSDGSPEIPTSAEVTGITQDVERVKKLRTRLSDISWLMRMVSEHIARSANREDGVTGRFWEGRFGSTVLCDEIAILACMMYIDLNPIRAGIAETPEQSKHTSAKLRIDQLRSSTPVANWLSPLTVDESAPPGPMCSRLATRCSDKGCLPIVIDDYLQLLDWTGRQYCKEKSAIPTDAPPILQRLGIDAKNWTSLANNFGMLFYRFAGQPDTLAAEAQRRGRRWYQAPGGQLLSATAA